MNKVTTGGENTCGGQNSLAQITTQSHNTGWGSGVLVYTTGSGNTALGSQVMGTATVNGQVTGDNNTGVGKWAFRYMQSGASNTAVGYQAGNGITTGDNNLLLGKDAGITGSPGGNISTGDNEVCIGDEAITEAHIQVDWTIASDKRDKTDVSPMDLGLEFINQLEPVTYRWDKRIKYSDDQSAIPDGTHKEEQLEGGFLAQDVESLEEQYGYKQSDKTNLTFSLSEDEQMYGIKYGKFVPMLVKAVQELSAEVEELKKQAHNKCNNN
jgi:hypothetical protein